MKSPMIGSRLSWFAGWKRRRITRQPRTIRSGKAAAGTWRTESRRSLIRQGKMAG
jgi:hypothetical protein